MLSILWFIFLPSALNLVDIHDGSPKRYAPRSFVPYFGASADSRLLADGFPSSAAFDAINAALQSSDAERKDAIKQGGAIFAFTLKNAQGETASWHIDLKEKGEVAEGTSAKPTGAFEARIT